jgi:DNA-binding MarR family transcriptional regulator
MTEPGLLTGRDIGEAEGAMTALLERALTPSGRSRAEYITLRLLAARGSFESPSDLADFLAGQRQLGLDRASAEALLDRMQADGLVTAGPVTPTAGPVTLTADGRAVLDDLAARIAPVTRQVFTGIERDDLAAAHRVLTELIERANGMTAVGGAR